MTVKVWKNQLGTWVREERTGWVIRAKAYPTKREAISSVIGVSAITIPKGVAIKK